MLRRVLSVLMGGASGACGFAALGVALYAQGPSRLAALLFGGFGFVCGAWCALLPSLRRRLPSQRHAELPDAARAGLVQAALASAAAGQPERSDTAIDRRPAEVTAAALAAAAVTSLPDTTIKAAAPDVVAKVGARRFAGSSFDA